MEAGSLQAERYDAIIIGTGQGGKPLAGAFAEAQWKTAIVEREALVGGTCVVVGCTPTKTMVASARVAHLARRGADYGVNIGALTVDQGTVRKRKRDIVDMFSTGSRGGLERHETLDLIFGEASFVEPHRLRITPNDGGAAYEIQSDHIFINAGARPATPKIPGLDSVPYLDSTSIMELDDTPEHLVVIGGGYIGLEFGQMFRRFGSRVTIVDRFSRLLAREEPEFGEAMAKILTDEGIELMLDAQVARVASAGSDVTVTVEQSDGRQAPVTGSHVLIAAGRMPNTDSLNTAAAGLDTSDRGHILVNERLETNVEGIWALGDINGGPAFTHIAYDDFRILRDNVLRDGNATTRDRLVPYVLYTDPQFGRVGINEQEAREQGLEIQVASMPMSHVARALETDESLGLMKAIVDANSGQILGAAVLGIEGGELMSMIEIAMMGKLPYTVLRDAVFAHPTFAEALNNLFGEVV